jgi:hypothetical protein
MVSNKFIREFMSIVHPIATISRAERFGGLEIDDQLHFCCTLNRQIGRFLAIENSAGIVAGLAISIRNV